MKSFVSLLIVVSVPATAANNVTTFRLWSPEVTAGATLKAKQVFNGFGCSGENVSPELRWEGAPANTKAFALTMYDPDAPTGSGWWHWIVYNLPPETTKLESGAGDVAAPKLPQGAAHGRNDYGALGFGGACPPKGDKAHRYVFTLFALKDKISVPPDASAALIGFQLYDKSLARAKLTAVYGR
jgi:Raf kinase inhibitor-like YbhB/YbcL family protein